MDRATALSILLRMLRMRRFEEGVIELHDRGEFSGVFQVYIGQESVGAAALEAATSTDYVLSTHRNHGHVVGRGADLTATFAEILGRTSGLLGGRGGTFHASAPALGMLQTSAIVGGCPSLAVGAGYAIQRTGGGRVAIAFFGDGALEEGVTFEALSIAQLWRVPVIFICENNSIGVEEMGADAYPRSMLGERTISAIPRAIGVQTVTLEDGLDVDEVFTAVCVAREACLRGSGPIFIEAPLLRFPGSQTIFPQSIGDTDVRVAGDSQDVRGPHEGWKVNHDPVIRWIRTSVERGLVTLDEVIELDREVRRAALAAAREATAGGLPDDATVADHVFA